MKDTIKIDAKSTKLIAHRGLSSLEKENTCASFEAAGRRPSYYGIETDIHRTADGDFIIIHNATVDNGFGETVEVEKSTYSELRKIRLEGLEHRICQDELRLPSLEEYVGICQKYGKKCILELKSDFTMDETKILIDRIAKTGYLENVVFISFVFEALLNVRAYLPHQKCQFLTDETTETVIRKCSESGFDIDTGYNNLTEELVNMAHELGLEMNVWTINTTEKSEELISWGVDYITTDCLEGKY